MAKSDLASAATEVHALLKDLESADRQKVIQAAMTLLGDAYVPTTGSGDGHRGGVVGAGAGAQGSPSGGGATGTALQFFDLKQPRGKVEELLVAARYREVSQHAETHTKEDLAAVIKAARRNFDANNFRRDLANAKTAKYFNLGKEIAVSYQGQKFVDALPDRDQAVAARSRRGRKKAKAAGKAKA
jgi:hypothetical protein